jgi:hypothetical protein
MIEAAERFQAIENGLRTLNLIVRIGWSAPPPCGLLPNQDDFDTARAAAVGDAGQRGVVTKRYRLLLLLR